MKYQVFRVTSNLEEKKNKVLPAFITGAFVISIFLTAVWFFPSTWSYLSGTACIAATAHYFWKTVKQKHLFILMDEEVIEYFSADTNAKTALRWEYVSSVHSSFGQLILYTSQSRHTINLASLHADTRWEIKELLKQMSKKYSFEIVHGVN